MGGTYLMHFLPYLIVAFASLGSGVIVHFLGRSHVAQAAEQKAVHLICSDCKFLVARFKQMEDSTIKCVNCLRAIERGR